MEATRNNPTPNDERASLGASSWLPFPNPFVGLRPFRTEESLLFFGRNEQTVELLQQLHKTRFLAVVGSSGCGKSSLIRAGLIPKLKAGFLIEDRDRWLTATMKVIYCNCLPNQLKIGLPCSMKLYNAKVLNLLAKETLRPYSKP